MPANALVRHYRAREACDLAKVLSFFDPDGEFLLNGEGAGLPGITELANGFVAVRQRFAALLGLFRLQHWRSTSLMVEDDTAALTWKADVECVATGKYDAFQAVAVCRFRDGKILSMREHTDTAKLANLLRRRPVLA
jgi:ketosteroid isomerase-like protein